MKCSIIIVTYNAKEYTEICLKKIFSNGLPDDYELILFDNNSSDGVVNVLHSYENQKNVKIIYHKQNLGFAVGNNEAVKHATGSYVFLLNPDTEIEISEIKKLVEYLEQNKSAGVVGPKIYDSNGLVQESYGRDMTIWSEFLGKIFGSVYVQNLPIISHIRMNHYDKKNITNVGWIGGAALMIRRDLYNKIGGIDPNFFYSAGDMVDLCASVKENNFEVIFYPNATMIHKGGASTVKDRMEALRRSYEGSLYYFNKHKGRVYTFFVRLVYSFISLIKGIISGFIWLVVKNKKYKDISKSHLNNLM